MTITALATATQLSDERTLERLNDASRIRLKLEADVYQTNLHAFLKAAWPLIEPQQVFVDNWHVRQLCHILQNIGNGNWNADRRWIFNIPPGTLKSILVSVIFNAWMWARNPRARFLTASYSGALSMRDNLRVRDIVESEWFKQHWPDFALAEDQKAKGRFNTFKKGWRIATSVGGLGTGEHPNFIIIDDPTSAQEALSAADRNSANAWFDNTISSRGVPAGVYVFVVMQRLHMEDLTGHLLAKGGWKHIYFPMRFESERPATADNPGYKPCEFDERKTEGELLFPVVFTEPKVKSLEIDLGEYGTAGQLQQHPSPEGGGLFKREWFKFADARPRLAKRVRGWDTAATDGGGDYTVGARVSEEFEMVPTQSGGQKAVSTGRIFVEHIVRGQWGPAEVDRQVKACAVSDGKRVPIREEREAGASGKGTIAARRKMLIGYDYDEVILGVDKRARAKAFRSQCEGGNVYLVRGSWNETYIDELCNFPTSSHDDQVDATTCAFNAMLLEEPPQKTSGSW